MASNNESGSTNPTNQNSKKKMIAADNNTSVPTATRLGRDLAAETEPQISNAVALTGKRRRSSEAHDTRNDFIGITTDSSSHNGEISTNAAALPVYQGNASNLASSEPLRPQQEAAQNNSQFLQTQLEGMYNLPTAAQSFLPPNAATLMIANQLRQAGGAAPFLHVPQVQSNNELQQQLSVLIQQHLYGVGLAQTLGINFPTIQEAIGGSFANINTTSYAQSSSQMMQGFAINPDSFPATLQATAPVHTSTNSTSDIPSSLHNRNDDSLVRTNRSSDTAIQQNDTSSGTSGRPPIQLYISCDDDSLSEYQCLVRKHIELFEAGIEDVESNAQGRNRPIVLGQVGIRCRHCTMLPPRHRSRGAIYYPAKLQGIYQAAQNLAVAHLGEHCQNVPEDVRATLSKLRERKSSAGGGKRYWANGVRVLGVFEDRDGLRFESRLALQQDGAT